MSRISRLVVLVAAVSSLVGVFSSTAGAVTWHNTGDTAFTATGGQGTLSATGISLACGNSDATGTVPALTVGATLGVAGTVTFTGCTLSGQAVGVDCGYRLTGISQTGSTGHLITAGNVDVTCGVYLAGTKICHIAGAPAGQYFNPTTNTQPGRLTIAPASLTIGNAGAINCPAGADDLASLTELTFTVSNGTGGPVPHTGPVITRTA